MTPIMIHPCRQKENGAITPHTNCGTHCIISLSSPGKNWTFGPRMNVARFSHTCNLIQRMEGSKEIIVVGGYDEHYNGLDSVEIYSLDNQTWRHGKCGL